MFCSQLHQSPITTAGAARQKFHCVFLLLVWLSYPSRSQDQAWHIAGTVYDEAGKALPLVSVYINNTSIGTSTDKGGNFLINVPARYQKAELVASFVGYKPEVKQLQATPGRTANVVFKLDLNNTIREVVIKGKHDKHWRRKWRVFQNGLLGDSPFARQCRILNRESITLGHDEATGRVTATSSEPVNGNFVPVTADSVCVFDKTKGYFILHSRYPLLVFQRRLYNSASVFSDYPFKYSQIVLPNLYCSFTENGWLIAPNGITIHDAWAREGFAEMLPIDHPLPGDTAPHTPVALIQNTNQAKETITTDLKLPAIESQQTLLNKEGAHTKCGKTRRWTGQTRLCSVDR